MGSRTFPNYYLQIFFDDFLRSSRGFKCFCLPTFDPLDITREEALSTKKRHSGSGLMIMGFDGATMFCGGNVDAEDCDPVEEMWMRERAWQRRS